MIHLLFLVGIGKAIAKPTHKGKNNIFNTQKKITVILQ